MTETKTLDDFIMEECESELWLPNDMPKIKKALYRWLESKRLMPLSRKPDMIEISDLQADCVENGGAIEECYVN
jgi:hypothetical protein